MKKTNNKTKQVYVSKVKGNSKPRKYAFGDFVDFADDLMKFGINNLEQSTLGMLGLDFYKPKFQSDTMGKINDVAQGVGKTVSSLAPAALSMIPGVGTIAGAALGAVQGVGKQISDNQFSKKLQKGGPVYNWKDFVIEKYKPGQYGTCPEGDCAKYRNRQVANMMLNTGAIKESSEAYSYLGDSAWFGQDAVVDTGGKRIWQKGQEMDYSSLRPGDMVTLSLGDSGNPEMLAPGSIDKLNSYTQKPENRYSKADKTRTLEKGGRHAGYIVGFTADGDPIVEHNISGKVKRNTMGELSKNTEHWQPISVFRAKPMLNADYSKYAATIKTNNEVDRDLMDQSTVGNVDKPLPSIYKDGKPFATKFDGALANDFRQLSEKYRIPYKNLMDNYQHLVGIGLQETNLGNQADVGILDKAKVFLKENTPGAIKSMKKYDDATNGVEAFINKGKNKLKEAFTGKELQSAEYEWQKEKAAIIDLEKQGIEVNPENIKRYISQNFKLDETKDKVDYKVSYGAFNNKDLTEDFKMHNPNANIKKLNHYQQLENSMSNYNNNYKKAQSIYPGKSEEFYHDIATLAHKSPSRAFNPEYIDFFYNKRNRDIGYLKSIDSENQKHRTQGQDKLYQTGNTVQTTDMMPYDPMSVKTNSMNKKFALNRLIKANELLSAQHRQENPIPQEMSDLRMEEMQKGGWVNTGKDKQMWQAEGHYFTDPQQYVRWKHKTGEYKVEDEENLFGEIMSTPQKMANYLTGGKYEKPSGTVEKVVRNFPGYNGISTEGKILSDAVLDPLNAVLGFKGQYINLNKMWDEIGTINKLAKTVNVANAADLAQDLDRNYSSSPSYGTRKGKFQGGGNVNTEDMLPYNQEHLDEISENLIQFNGPSHDQGGIKTPAGEFDRQETVLKPGVVGNQAPFAFSDNLTFSKETLKQLGLSNSWEGKTIADVSKKIESKFKDDISDDKLKKDTKNKMKQYYFTKLMEANKIETMKHREESGIQSKEDLTFEELNGGEYQLGNEVDPREGAPQKDFMPYWGPTGIGKLPNTTKIGESTSVLPPSNTTGIGYMPTTNQPIEGLKYPNIEKDLHTQKIGYNPKYPGYNPSFKKINLEESNNLKNTSTTLPWEDRSSEYMTDETNYGENPNFDLSSLEQIGLGSNLLGQLGQLPFFLKKERIKPQYNQYQAEVLNQADNQIDLQKMLDNQNNLFATQMKTVGDRSYNVTRGLLSDMFGKQLDASQKASLNTQLQNIKLKNKFASVLDMSGQQNVQARNLQEDLQARTNAVRRNAMTQMIGNIGQNMSDVAFQKDFADKTFDEGVKLLNTAFPDFQFNAYNRYQFMKVLSDPSLAAVKTKFEDGEYQGMDGYKKMIEDVKAINLRLGSGMEKIKPKLTPKKPEVSKTTTKTN